MVNTSLQSRMELPFLTSIISTEPKKVLIYNKISTDHPCQLCLQNGNKHFKKYLHSHIKRYKKVIFCMPKAQKISFFSHVCLLDIGILQHSHGIQHLAPIQYYKSEDIGRQETTLQVGNLENLKIILKLQTCTRNLNLSPRN